ncbi:DEAD/DEAH box helicase [Serratia fonticola]|uniref:DEAD/DEAH box helicase n=1 Tax=Serratia fonticola TaxID=47917 RepID=UPI00217CA7E7|nr:AAA domain-containing protein [Serratia fonticola]CAI1210435.1 putative DNA helicase [Serratia fonticola]
MAIPLVIAAGLSVLATAKAVSWIFNIMTEEEQERQCEEQQRTRQTRARAEKARALQEQERKVLLAGLAMEHAQTLIAVVEECRLKIAGLPDELKELEKMIGQEVESSTSSPYRKSALRREYARIEDAAVRLREYQVYLNTEQQRINDLLISENFTRLLELESAQPVLPLEWLYPGKLVLVTLDEIGKPLPGFGHRISFGVNDAVQKALALDYGQNIPVHIKSAHKQHANLFYGCVARGALWYHNIMPGEPVEFTVEGVNKSSYAVGTLFNGLLEASLPLSQLKYPGMRLLTGQKMLVYPTHYDLCLTRNPFDNKNKRIEVSEFNYSTRGAHSYQQLYLTTDESLFCAVTDQRFFDPLEPWTLLSFSTTTGIITLAKASVRVECRAAISDVLLEVSKVIQTQGLQIGLDTPFRFTLIARELVQSGKISWSYGVQEFLRFCAQMALDMNESSERLANGRFYQRWEQVIEWQRSQEENFVLAFPLSAAEREDGEVRLQRTRLPASDQTSFDRVFEALQEVLSESNMLSTDQMVELLQWDAERSIFIPALRSDHRNRPYYTCHKGCISISGDFSLLNENTVMMRLLVTLPNMSLKRQGQALEDFAYDKMVNPELKNALLAPEQYLSSQQALLAPLQWSTKLDDSQKRVVELALVERNIVLIQGPPGAGKTTAIVEMLYQLFRQNPNRRVLVVSQQNAAVDNALSKFLDKHASGLGYPVNAIRVGNPQKMSKSIQPLSVDNQQTQFIAQLEKRAIYAAVTEPDPFSTLCHQWHATLQQVSQSRSGREEFFITLLSNRNLIGATCVGLATNKGGIDQLQFDVAIIDEAGRATVPEILIPILRSGKVILVGDHFQLPPSIAPLLREDEASQQLKFLQEDFLDTSFFELMFNRLPEQCREVLDRQYRMAPAIGNLVAELFYTSDNVRKLHNGRPDSDFDPLYLLDETIYWVDVRGRQKRPSKSTSYENELEAKEIAQFLTRLAMQVDRETSVAIITPYGAQKNCIREQLKRIGCGSGKLEMLSVEVDTVDAFQGSEADIVCYSTVRSEGSLNFILDRKRLNVACSRARLHLLFFGHREFLRNWRPKSNQEENLFAKIIARATLRPIAMRSENNEVI